MVVSSVATASINAAWVMSFASSALRTAWSRVPVAVRWVMVTDSACPCRYSRVGLLIQLQAPGQREPHEQVATGLQIQSVPSLSPRICAGTLAQGASITSITTRPWPCAITPQPGHPASWLHDSTSSTRASGVRAMPIRWKPSKPTSRTPRSQRSSDAEQQQVG